MAKCPHCKVDVNAFRDATGRLIVTDPRIKVYSIIRVEKTDFRPARVDVVRTTLHEAEHAPLCTVGGRYDRQRQV